MDPTTRLRIATRIHFALLRQYGEQIDVAGLLQGHGEAREALWVCEASGDAELVGLARQLKAADHATAEQARASRRSPRPDSAFMPMPATPRTAPQDAVWAQDTSGFGLTRPLETAPAPLPGSAPATWLNPASWLRRSARR